MQAARSEAQSTPSFLASRRPLFWSALAAVGALNLVLAVWWARGHWFALDDFSVLERQLVIVQNHGAFWDNGQFFSGLKGTRDLFRFPFYFLLTRAFGFSYPAFLIAATLVRVGAAAGAFGLARRLGLAPLGALGAALFYSWNPTVLRAFYWISPISQPLCHLLIFVNLILVCRLDRPQRAPFWAALVATEVGALLAHEHASVLFAYQVLVALLVLRGSLRERRLWGFALLSLAMVGSMVVFKGRLAVTTSNNAYGTPAAIPGNLVRYLGELASVATPLGVGLVALLDGRRRQLSPLGLFALAWMMVSFGPYSMATRFNDYYCMMGAFSAALMFGALLDLALAAPASGAVWSPLFAVLLVVAAQLHLARVHAEQVRIDPLPEGQRALRALRGLAQAAGLSPREFDERLAHPCLRRPPRAPIALYVRNPPIDSAPQTPWREFEGTWGLQAVLSGVFDPIYVDPPPGSAAPETAGLVVALAADGSVSVESKRVPGGLP
jgi:hypothetical protein